MWAFIVSLPSDRESSSLLVGAAKLAREAVGRPPVRRTVGSGGVAVERRTWRGERSAAAERGWGKGGACCAVPAGGDDVDGRVKSDAQMLPVVMLGCILQTAFVSQVRVLYLTDITPDTRTLNVLCVTGLKNGVNS